MPKKHVSRNKNSLQDKLLAWFNESKRIFPWRNTTNPFNIIVAEKLLQQTRACEPVISAYNRLTSRYPTPAALSRAKLEDIQEIIKPLGLIFRAKHLLKMSEEIVEHHNGLVPKDLDELLQLTGIGEYCSRAVLSFAFKQNIPIVDTNVARFLHRVYGINSPTPVNPSRKKYLFEMASDLLPKGKSRNFNFAVLDLCAEICKPKKPKCFKCPIRSFCKYDKKLS